MLLSRFSHVQCTMCDPTDSSPSGSPRPWDSPGKNTGVGCHFLLQCMNVKSESEVTQSCPTLSNLKNAAYQAPPYMGFSKQEYQSGFPLPSPPLKCKQIKCTNQKTKTGWADENMCMYVLLLTTSVCLTPQVLYNYFIPLG